MRRHRLIKKCHSPCLQYCAPAGAPALALGVRGSYAQFTLVTFSFEDLCGLAPPSEPECCIPYVHAPAGPPALPLAVGGSYAQFTLVTLSFEGRAAGLPRWVAHYGRCPSVAEIVVVWNRGPPPKVCPATR